MQTGLAAQLDHLGIGLARIDGELSANRSGDQVESLSLGIRVDIDHRSSLEQTPSLGIGSLESFGKRSGYTRQRNERPPVEFVGEQCLDQPRSHSVPVLDQQHDRDELRVLSVVAPCGRHGRTQLRSTRTARRLIDQICNRETQLTRDLAGIEFADIGVRVFVDHRQGALAQTDPLLWRLRHPLAHDAFETEREERQRGRDRLDEPLRVTAGQITRVAPVGQPGNRDLDLVFLLPLIEPFRSTLAGGIGIEGQYDTVRISLDQADMLLGERRSTGGHRSGEAGAMEADHVGIALTDDDLIVLDDLPLGPIQPIKGLGFGVQSGLRRVLVLGWVLRARKHPTTERDRGPLFIEDREQHSCPKRILEPTGSIDEGEAGLAQGLCVDTAMSGELIPGVGRPAEAELTSHVSAETATAQIIARRAGRRIVQQTLVVPLDGGLHRRLEPLALLTGSTLAGRGVTELETGAIGELFDRADEVGVFDLLDEGEHIA